MHESKADAGAKLARKGNGKEAKLSYSAHALMENRNGLLVGSGVVMGVTCNGPRAWSPESKSQWRKTV